MAQAVLELKDNQAIDSNTENSIQYFLDRFYMSRISTRMLLNQHTMLFGAPEDRETRPNRVGVIDTNCRLKNLVMEAYTNAGFLCEEYYCFVPEVNVESNNSLESDRDAPIEICYPPQHLYHILFELFKNSMRAVIESRRDNLFDIPPIEVLLVNGPSDVTIRISDRGGGISRQVTDTFFLYLTTTAPRPSMTPERAPLAGYGYGLPLSRLYSRYGSLITSVLSSYVMTGVPFADTFTAIWFLTPTKATAPMPSST